MEMAFGLRQEQTMRLAPQIIQSIEILQLPLLALEERLQTELIENPVLEMEEKQEDAPPAEAKESVPDTFDSLGEEWSEHFAQWAPRSIRNVERDRKLDAMQNTSARGMSLQDFLLSQVSLLEVNERQRTVLQNVICNIDANGYLQYPLEEILPTVGLPDVTLAELEEALRTVRAMDPPGVGACDLKECLLLQLDPDDAHLVLKTELIQNHLEDIRSNRFPQIAKETGRALEEVKKAVEFILTLNPKPGALFDNSEPAYIMPDVIVDEADDGFDVKLHESGLPRLIISPFYRKLLMSQSNSVGTKDYIRKKIQSARWLIDAIEQRRDTLLRISREIFRVQREFLDHGIKFLRPLKMRTVAERTNVHVSTVSRAVAEKYAQTPRGIFPLKFFFTGGTKAADGEEESRKSVRQRVLDAIEKEDKQRPLSDGEIAKMLQSKGLDIARRTVTKYRKAMGIPTSRRRRAY
jgi:RNA polymerase sigma-54 factor